MLKHWNCLFYERKGNKGICRTTSVSTKNSAKDPASRTTHDSNIQENVRTNK